LLPVVLGGGPGPGVFKGSGAVGSGRVFGWGRGAGGEWETGVALVLGVGGACWVCGCLEGVFGGARRAACGLPCGGVGWLLLWWVCWCGVVLVVWGLLLRG
jgi:hypothetical protein